MAKLRIINHSAEVAIVPWIPSEGSVEIGPGEYHDVAEPTDEEVEMLEQRWDYLDTVTVELVDDDDEGPDVEPEPKPRPKRASRKKAPAKTDPAKTDKTD